MHVATGLARRMPTLGVILPALLAVWLQPHSCAAAAVSAATACPHLLEALQKNGYLSAADALAASKEFAPLLAEHVVRSSKWDITGYLSLANFFKVVAIGLLLCAFWQTIVRIAGGLWHLIEKLPLEVWQGLFVSVSMAGLLCAPLLAPHTLYIALFCAFSNLIIATWIVFSHDHIVKWLEKLDKKLEVHGRVSLQCIASFMLAMYFGVLAFAFASEIFGFFTAVCVSAMTSFGMMYCPGLLVLYFQRSALNQVVFGNLLVVAAHITLELTGIFPMQVQLFKKGVNFYCTVAAGVGFLVGASPYRFIWGDLSELTNSKTSRKKKADKPDDTGRNMEKARSQRRTLQLYHPMWYLLWFILTLSVAMVVYFVGGVKSVGSILCVFAVLLALEWIGMYAFQTGTIIGLAVVGAVLYGGVWMLEHGPVGAWLWEHLIQNLAG